MGRVIASSIACVIGALLSFGIAAQEDSELPPGYIPLFTEVQIQNASPETRQRMRETERINRETWLKRQLPRAGRVEGSGEDPAEPSAEPASEAPRRAGRRKIYRWVDADGRVNFGDSPPSKAAEEVKMRGTEPPSPSPAREGNAASVPRGGSDVD